MTAEKGQLPAYRRAARTVRCTVCGAGAGDPCRTSAGRAAPEHAGRFNTTRRAQNIGYEEGLRDALSLLDWKAINGVEEVRKQLLTQFDMVRRSNAREEAANVES